MATSDMAGDHMVRKHMAGHHTVGNVTLSALADTVWPAVPSGGLVLLPVGSTEQHGPHLPLDTDTDTDTDTGTGSVIAEAVARRASTALPGTLVAPTLPYGAALEYRRDRTTLGPLRYGAARRLDDLAYGAGVWLSALRARPPSPPSGRAATPRHPLRRPHREVGGVTPA